MISIQTRVRWRHSWVIGAFFSVAHAHDNVPVEATQSSSGSTSTEFTESVATASTANTEIDFDVSALKSLGYGAEVADFFKHGSQFLPGQYDVTIVVNGSARYPATVTIGDAGQMCFTPALQKTLKLKAVAMAETATACPDIVTLYPSAQVTPHPNTFTLDLLVAETDFDPQLRGDELTYGGFAVFSNYRVYGMQMKGVDTQHFYQGQFESGVNWHNWLLRNNSSVSAGQNSTQYQFNETTLARSIASWRSMVQLGQINSQGNLFGGTPLNGIQLYSDTSLQTSNTLVVPITGVAESPATVEVLQNGRL